MLASASRVSSCRRETRTCHSEIRRCSGICDGFGAQERQVAPAGGCGAPPDLAQGAFLGAIRIQLSVGTLPDRGGRPRRVATKVRKGLVEPPAGEHLSVIGVWTG
jgi:hypothetical protein